MFDGKHTSRRAINLGSSTSKSSNRQAVLDEARRKREQRQLLAKQTEACITVQRYYRGFQHRRYVVQILDKTLLGVVTSSSILTLNQCMEVDEEIDFRKKRKHMETAWIEIVSILSFRLSKFLCHLNPILSRVTTTTATLQKYSTLAQLSWDVLLYLASPIHRTHHDLPSWFTRKSNISKISKVIFQALALFQDMSTSFLSCHNHVVSMDFPPDEARRIFHLVRYLLVPTVGNEESIDSISNYCSDLLLGISRTPTQSSSKNPRASFGTRPTLLATLFHTLRCFQEAMSSTTMTATTISRNSILFDISCGFLDVTCQILPWIHTTQKDPVESEASILSYLAMILFASPNVLFDTFIRSFLPSYQELSSTHFPFLMNPSIHSQQMTTLYTTHWIQCLTQYLEHPTRRTWDHPPSSKHSKMNLDKRPQSHGWRLCKSLLHHLLLDILSLVTCSTTDPNSSLGISKNPTLDPRTMSNIPPTLVETINASIHDTEHPSSSLTISISKIIQDIIRLDLIGKELILLENVFTFVTLLLDHDDLDDQETLGFQPQKGLNEQQKQQPEPSSHEKSGVKIIKLSYPKVTNETLLSTFLPFLSVMLFHPHPNSSSTSSSNVPGTSSRHAPCADFNMIQENIKILSAFVARDGGEGGKAWSILLQFITFSNNTNLNDLISMKRNQLQQGEEDMEIITIDSDEEGENEYSQPMENKKSSILSSHPNITTDHRSLDQSRLEATQSISSIRRRPTASLSDNSKRQRKPTNTLQNNAGRKLTRDDLLTASKLDRMYHDMVFCDFESSLAYLRSLPRGESEKNLNPQGDYARSIAKVAMMIGKGEILIKIGSRFLGILQQRPYHTDSKRFPSSLEAYIRLLGSTLLCSSGIRSRSDGSSPILSKLSFLPDLLDYIWSYVLSQTSIRSSLQTDTYSKSSSLISKAVFSDIFAQFLLSVDDDEFLRRFATIDKANSVIVAEQVMNVLRDTLYELYCVKPVTASEVSSSILSATATNEKTYRVRLFLSGTKLFNYLYERWSRLVRVSPFCEENTWWFPWLSLNDDDVSAIVVNPDRVHDNDEMDEESDHSDEEQLQIDRPSNAPSTRDEENDALASLFRDPKIARILTSIPQVLPFDRRAKLFHALLASDKEKRTIDEMNAMQLRMMAMRDGNDDDEINTGREKVTIRRDALFSDSMEQLNHLGKRLRRQIQVSFVNQHGASEAGIDGGGVFREFLDDLIRDAFDPTLSHGDGTIPPLFCESPTQTLSVNLDFELTSDILSHYEFLGRILGKAVYESILVEAQFSLPFINQLLGRVNGLDDLKTVDPEFYRNLMSLRKMTKEQVESLGLTFEMTSARKGSKSIELIPSGRQILVTQDNVIRYIHLIAHHRLNVESSYQTRAFLQGFCDLIPTHWMRIFSAQELQKVIGGDDTIRGIDVASLKAAMQYSGGYHPSQLIIQWFWQIIEELSPMLQKKFLKFMTSCSRQPLLGFQSLVPLPCIQQVRLPEHHFEMLRMNPRLDVRLPTSATCMNLLKLPNYPTKELLYEKLVYAIESGSGFELS